MRQARALVVLIGVTLLFASEVFPMAPASDQNSNVATPTSQVQRLLRTHHTIIKRNAENEERSLMFVEPPLSMDDMKAMMKEGISREMYARKLGIAEQMAQFITSGLPGIEEFKGTSEFKKYEFYMNFLNDMLEDDDYKPLVKMINEEKGKTPEFQALLVAVEEKVKKKQSLVKIGQTLNKEQALAAKLEQVFSKRKISVVSFDQTLAANAKVTPSKWKLLKLVSKLIKIKR
ncbi:hypothetical protein F442_07527 [Phytophthora nicotianae P10297]|uniref:PexRD2 WYL domain-containing protein n=3 Tax=Phytophthora nicotianae TaxID=4792 RepID=W2QB56_PHYN3|nr:hypothetical protein PPTG_10520 [Phytophthora nicotianae INRA-310]ETN10382.1 hypothetical protein PPTG_10520 [Phytophthora nicotianae INRA-310]ETP46198.1 hypothetical protein F442_07527 [Phytophthora nicotianae P10297]KUF82277.1 hypothetical protein AM587_10007579 [Phytophthora nicotianae]KUF93802.1 26S protease regulatory subunit 6B [Phytophthora nicotianae]